MPRKRFIDPKHATTFTLVHRSQQDPLAADENAAQMVLRPENAKTDKHIAEEHKFGIYYDDDYNYLQHIRETGKMEWERVENKVQETDASLNLPSSVFASNVEEKVGLLNKAAPESGLRLDLDPELVAAMEDDFNFSDPDNELEDNFMDMANAECSDDDSDEECSSNFESGGGDEVRSLREPLHTFQNEETKSRITKYSLTSSVIRRNDQLQLLDRRFEKFYATYDDDQIGALDGEEIEGHIPLNSDILLQYADEFERDRTRKQLDKPEEKLPVREYFLSDSSDTEYETVPVPVKAMYDCNSILKRNSNTYINQPRTIETPQRRKIKIHWKTGMPMDVLNSNKLTSKTLKAFNEEHTMAENGGSTSSAESVVSKLSTLSMRPKDETGAQRRERKKLLKEYRRERRVEKKTNKLAFAEEIKRQRQIANNNRNNKQGNTIV